MLRNVPVGTDLCFDLQRSLPHGYIKTIFDVGANVGQSAMWFSGYLPVARIVSFEPVESTYRQLTTNTSRFPKVQCVHAALGAAEETRRLFHQPGSQQNSLVDGSNRPSELESYEDVKFIALADFCKREGIERIELLKTDTEGFDLEVIRGATAMLEAARIPFIYSEVTLNTSNPKHTNFFEMLRFLEKYNFKFVSIYEQYTNATLTESDACNALFANAEAL